MINKKTKIAVVGSGAMGTAMSKVLYDNNFSNIVIYGVDQQELTDLKQGKNTKYFDENQIKLPHFQTSSNLEEALKDSEYVILAVPSKIMDVVFAKVNKIIESNKKPVFVISVSKGFYPNSGGQSLHAGLEHDSKDNKYIRAIVSISGPSYAIEIIEENFTAICAINKDEKIAEEAQELFTNDYFKIYVQTDVIGAEVGASFKNVLAILAGIATESKYGINTITAIITRGLAEMRRYNKYVGGQESTLLGLTGVGDLILTATSDKSRNFSFGRELVRKGHDALNTNTTVEGLSALKNIYENNKTYKIYLPIVDSLYKFIFEKSSLEDLKKGIWNQVPKKEF